MKRFLVSVCVIIAGSAGAFAIGFGGYYSMSFPSEDYNGRDLADIDFEGSFLNYTVKTWYDINPNIGGRIEFPVYFLTPYMSAGTKVKLFGPVSFDISPTYSYVLGNGGEGNKVERLSTLDLDFGVAVDF